MGQLCCSGKQKGGICLTFLSLYHRVAMPVLPFPCQYSCFYAGTAVARLRRGCWKRTSGCFEDEKVGDETGVMLWLLNPSLLPAQRHARHRPSQRALGSDRIVAACGRWCDGWRSIGLGPGRSLSLRCSPSVAWGSPGISLCSPGIALCSPGIAWFSSGIAWCFLGSHNIAQCSPGIAQCSASIALCSPWH